MTSPTINGDLRERVSVDTTEMAWQPSPSVTVWRKRLHLVGSAEAGQVTSVVRYDSGASFPVHGHPGGEEVLVLEGTFSDEHGDWPAGTYLLNPDGFIHAPFSRDGCVLFVKLRQYPGARRRHVCLDTRGLDWKATGEPGIEVKPLYSQDGFTDSMQLERWKSGTVPAQRRYDTGAEMFVLDGAFEDDDGRYKKGCWLRLPPGSEQQPRTASGCTLYVKRGGFAYLESGNSG